MYQLKELLGLVVYKGERPDQQHPDSSGSQLNVSVSTFRVENSNIKMPALDMSHDDRQASFDLNSSFVHTFTGSIDKLIRVFTLCEKVYEEMDHLLVD